MVPMGLDFAASRDALRRGQRLLRQVSAALARVDEAFARVRAAHADLTTAAVAQQLGTLDLASLREVTSATSLHLAPLRAAGINNVAQVLAAPDARLLALPGLGTERVRAIRSAAETVRDAALRSQSVRLDPDHRNHAADALVSALATALPLQAPGRQLAAWDVSQGARLANATEQAGPARNRLSWLLAGKAGREQAGRAAERIEGLVSASSEAEQAARTIEQLPRRKERPSSAWQRFLAAPGDFYAELERVTGSFAPGTAVQGGLTSEIVARIERQPLDESLISGALRTYQHFGVRFILAQRRVIVGDEMGLGKTFQAIAAMAHLAASGETHFVVICPASVLVGWGREIAIRSKLRAHRVHGDDRDAALRRWTREGGVAVTTFETLRRLDWPAQPPAMVVVDEAHYIKNPDAQRSQASAALLAASPRAVLLTGTPLENRVDEMCALVDLVRPGLADQLDRAALRLGPTAFRHELAPVYLRRNQSDVLLELPERIETDEWVELDGNELRAYGAAVAEGNWMAMRQITFGTEKLERLVDLCEDAAANQRKVVVFSYFLGVLDEVCRTLGARAIGPMTGSISPLARQELVDEFTAAAPGAVLVCQVQAGGVGLNIQAAQVVILCEPQLKPSTESQAIARVHRMGQPFPVEVHRLCAEDTIDERVIELLAGKQRIFDDYAARSTLAEASDAAIDPGRPGVAATLLAVEQARLAAR